MTTDEWGLPESDDQQDFHEPETSFGGWDTEGVDAAEIGSGVIKVDKPGMYHFLLEAKARPLPYEKDDMSKHRKPDILCSCMVLQSVPGQSPEASIHYHSLIIKGKGPGAGINSYDEKKTCNFLVGLGVLMLREGKVIDPETGTTKINLNTLATRLHEKQFIGRIELSESYVDRNGKEQPSRCEFSWGRGAFQVNDPKVKDVPKNLDMLRAGGYLDAAGNLIGGGPAVPASSAHKPPASSPAVAPAMAPDL